MADEAIKRLIELGVNATPAVKELDRLGKATEKQTATLDDLQKKLGQFGSVVTNLFALDVIAGFASQVVGGIRRMIDAMDDLNKRAQGLGVGVEHLQELEHAFDMAGVNSQQLDKALVSLTDKLANMRDESAASTKVLKSFGVTAGDDVHAALLKIADGFQKAQDGVTKTAYASELFGAKLGAKMIPALNAGSQGFAQAAEEAKQFGLVVGGDATKAAEEFNDNMTRVERQIGAVGKAIVIELLPSLNKLSEMLVDNIRQLGLWEGALNTIMQAIFGTDRERIARDAQAAQDRVDELSKSLRELRAGGFGTGGLIGMLGGRESQIRATEKALSEANGELNYRLTLLRQQQDLENEREATLKRAQTPTGTAKLDGSLLVKTAKDSAKAAKEAKTEWERWIESLARLQDQASDLPEKIKLLEDTLADMRAAGEGNTEWARLLQIELEKLKPDPVAEALRNIAKAAAELDRVPATIAAISARLDELAKAGQGASNEAKLLRDRLNDLEGSLDPMRKATGEVEKLRETQRINNAMLNAYLDLLAQGAVSAEEFARATKKYNDEVGKSIEDTTEKTKSLSDAVGEFSARFVTDFVDELIDGLGRAEQSFSDMVESFLKQLAKLMFSQQMQALLKAVESSGGWGSILTSLGSAMASAKGNAWAGPGVEYMAQGGILSRPSMFMSGPRLAVAGEAGPEAVVPLQRTASGDLGVAAAPVTVNVYNNADAEVTEQTRDNADGSRQIDIYIERKVKDLMTSGAMDRTMRSTYGVARQPALG